MERKYNDLIGDILERTGEKDNNNIKGMGKPLPKEYIEMDTFQLFQKKAKEAGYLPAWLELQKEISNLVHSCKTEQDVIVINEKIRRHNLICPAQLQKGFIALEKLDAAKKIW